LDLSPRNATAAATGKPVVAALRYFDVVTASLNIVCGPACEGVGGTPSAAANAWGCPPNGSNANVAAALFGASLRKCVIHFFQLCALRGISSLKALMKKVRAVLPIKHKTDTKYKIGNTGYKY